MYFHDFTILSDVFSVRQLHILLFHHRIVHGGIDFLMPQELLDLLYGHSLVYGRRSQRPAELVRMDLREVQAFSEFSEPGFHAANQQAFIRGFERDEEGRVTALPHIFHH